MFEYSIEDYSDRAIAVFCGGTKDANSYHSFLVDKLNGKYNEALRPINSSTVKRAGYIFGKKRLTEIEKELKAEQTRLMNKGTPYSASTTSTTSTSSSVAALSSTVQPQSINEKLICNLVAKVDALEAELAAIRALIEAGGIDVSKLTLVTTSVQTTRKKAKIQEPSDDDDGEEKEAPSLIKRKQQK